MLKCADMEYHEGVTVRIYPSYRQKRIIAVNDGCSRFVYNRLVALNNERFMLSKTASLIPAYMERISFIDSILHGSACLSSALKNSAPFLYGKDVDSMTIDNAIRNYNAAWNKYRETPTAGIPVFHKKSYEQRYQTNAHYNKNAEGINDGNVRIEDIHHAVIPLLGKIRISGSYKVLSSIIGRKNTRIGTITVMRDSIGRYFVSFQLSSAEPFVQVLPGTGHSVGIDLNIKNFLWDSDNVVIDNPKYRRSLQNKLAEAQRAMARKAVRAKKEKRNAAEGKNYQKDRIRAAYLHGKIKARGEDFRHVVSKRYVENQDRIFAEDLKVKNLLKNHMLAMAISECGWSDFLHKLEYKAELYGRLFMKVPPQLTTQTCSKCGYVLEKGERLSLSDREWICPSCGEYHVRDYNSAKVILSRGLAALGIPSGPGL